MAREWDIYESNASRKRKTDLDERDKKREVARRHPTPPVVDMELI